VSINLPGYREDPVGHTYGRFTVDELAPIERRLDDQLHWLLEQPVAKDWAILSRADAQGLQGRRAKLLGDHAGSIPPPFEAFISSRWSGLWDGKSSAECK
jgi:hypothetical protein